MNLEQKRARDRARYRKRAQSKRRRTLAPQFIAIDGEGLSVPDGMRQPYGLLAASTGEFIEDYADGGLSTVQCLEFLLQLSKKYPQAQLVIFGGGYDMTQWLRDLPDRNARELAETGETLYRFAINGWFEIRFLPGKRFDVRQTFQHPSQNRGVVHTKPTTIYDVFGYFQSSFVVAIRDWGIADAETLERIESMKISRPDFRLSDAPEILKYCLEETRLLTSLMDAVAEAIESVPSLPMPRKWHGAGAIADAIMADRYMGDALEERDPAPAAVDRSYYGGRIEITRCGLVDPGDGLIYEYDLRSAYPSALARLPAMRGEWIKRPSYTTDEHGVWFVRWDVRGHAVAPYLGPLPLRASGGLWWPLTGSGWYQAIEVAAAIEVFGDMIKVEEGWTFHPDDPDSRPWSWIEELYRERAAIKLQDQRDGTRRNHALKLGLNSCYGKTAQRATWRRDRGSGQPVLSEGRWTHRYVAGYQTASTRAQMLSAASQAPQSLLSIATDAVAFTDPIDLDIGANLGQWEMSTYDMPAMWVQPGFVIPEINEQGAGMKLRVRGGLSTSVGFGNFREAWERDGLRAVVDSPDTRFLGLRMAVAQNKTKLRGSWFTGTRYITFKPDRRLPGKNGGDFVQLLPPSSPAGLALGMESQPVEEPTGRDALMRWAIRDGSRDGLARG